MALLPVLFGYPAVLLPMHIAFLELIIDPSCSLVFENEPAEADAMQRPPRDPKARLFGGATLWRALLQGSAVLALTFGAYVWASASLAEAGARAFAFTVLVVANLALIFANRSRSVQRVLRANNPLLWIVTGGTLGLLALALYLPALAAVFSFASLSVGELLTACALGIVGAVITRWLRV